MSYISYSSEVEHINRDEDKILAYQDNTHVCLFKLFPLCRQKHNISYEDYRRFHLRFYLPKENVMDKEKKVERIIIMFNGLNEVEYFTLYNQLGYAFASNGIASVLLPLPDHLNRNARFRYKNPNEEQKRLTPFDTLYERPLDTYKTYLQLMNETDLLVSHLRGHNCSLKGDCDFFKHTFEKDLKISVLGYSLGGLAAMATFLKNRENYSACFLLNSGVTLSDINTAHMKKRDKWKRFVKKLQKEFADKSIFISKKDTAYSNYFNQIFLGNQLLFLVEELKEHSKRVLFIFGGSDSTVPFKDFKDLEEEGYGLALFKIPGIKHFLAIDKEWTKWFDFVVNLIIEYKSNAERELYTYYDLMNKFVEFQRRYNIFQKKDPFDISDINDPGDQDGLRKAYHASIGYFSDIEGLKQKIFEELKNKK